MHCSGTGMLYGVAGVRALIYSGDLDWQVPWTGSQHWTSQLGPTLGLLAGWRPWFRPDPFSYGSQVRSLSSPVAVDWHTGLLPDACRSDGVSVCCESRLYEFCSHVCTVLCTRLSLLSISPAYIVNCGCCSCNLTLTQCILALVGRACYGAIYLPRT